MKILDDGSMEGETFSGKDYKGEYPTPKVDEETYQEFYERVEACKKKGFHLGDLSNGDWHDYCYGSPAGGGQHVRNYIIGQVPDYAWITYEQDTNDDDDL